MALGSRVLYKGYNHQGLYLVVTEYDLQFASGKKETKEHSMFYGSKESYLEELKAYEKIAKDMQESNRKFLYSNYNKNN